MKIKKAIKIGIIGFGPFGQFIMKYLAPYFDVKVTSRKKRENLAKELGGEFLNFPPLVKNSDILIISVAIPAIPKILGELKNYIKPDTLVVDVASVKIFSTEKMIKLLPSNVQILGTHPLFGPQSGKYSIKDLKIVLSPIRIGDEYFSNIKKFLENILKLKVFVMSPEEHDKAMSRTQVITQFIGRMLKQIPIHEEPLSLPSYELLLDVYYMLKEDSDDLFNAIQLYNPYAFPMRDHLKTVFMEIYNTLDKKPGKL